MNSGIDKSQPETYNPDCSKTFYSIDETEKLASPLIVCKLDLSKSEVTSLPKEIYEYKNLSELNLGTTSIPEADINALQKALPKCKIIYTRQQAIPNGNAYNQNAVSDNEKYLGLITLDEKGGVSSASKSLVNAIAKQLVTNKQSTVKFEASYTDKQQYSIIYDGLITITNTLKKKELLLRKFSNLLQKRYNNSSNSSSNNQNLLI